MASKPKRHGEFYIEHVVFLVRCNWFELINYDLIIAFFPQVEDTLFKLPRAPFERAGIFATIFTLPAGDGFSEPVFVPRSEDAAEGDGWLLATVWRAAENRSDVAVFDTAGLKNGPVATIRLPHRVPAGFHGNWVANAV